MSVGRRGMTVDVVCAHDITLRLECVVEGLYPGEAKEVAELLSKVTVPTPHVAHTGWRRSLAQGDLLNSAQEGAPTGTLSHSVSCAIKSLGFIHYQGHSPPSAG